MAIAEAVPTRSDAVDVYEEETRPLRALAEGCPAPRGLRSRHRLHARAGVVAAGFGARRSSSRSSSCSTVLSPTVERVINGGLEWFTALVGVVAARGPPDDEALPRVLVRPPRRGPRGVADVGVVVWLLEHHHPDELLNQIADRARHHSNRHGEPSGVRGTSPPSSSCSARSSRRSVRRAGGGARVAVGRESSSSPSSPSCSQGLDSSRSTSSSPSACGWFVGATRGRPGVRRAGPAPVGPQVADVAACLGLPVPAFEPGQRRCRGSTPWFATTSTARTSS